MQTDSKTCGFLLPKVLRVLYNMGAYAPLSISVLGVWCIFQELFAERNDMSVTVLVWGIILLIFSLLLRYSFLRKKPVVNAQYCLSQHGALNIVGNRKVEVSLQESFFLFNNCYSFSREGQSPSELLCLFK